MWLIWWGVIWLMPASIFNNKKENICILLVGIVLAFLSFRNFEEFIGINKSMITGILSFPWEILGPFSIPIYAFIIWEILGVIFAKNKRNNKNE